MKGKVPSLALGNLNAHDNLEFEKQVIFSHENNADMHDAYATANFKNQLQDFGRTDFASTQLMNYGTVGGALGGSSFPPLEQGPQRPVTLHQEAIHYLPARQRSGNEDLQLFFDQRKQNDSDDQIDLEFDQFMQQSQKDLMLIGKNQLSFQNYFEIGQSKYKGEPLQLEQFLDQNQQEFKTVAVSSDGTVVAAFLLKNESSQVILLNTVSDKVILLNAPNWQNSVEKESPVNLYVDFQQPSNPESLPQKFTIILERVNLNASSSFWFWSPANCVEKLKIAGKISAWCNKSKRVFLPDHIKSKQKRSNSTEVKLKKESNNVLLNVKNKDDFQTLPQSEPRFIYIDSTNSQWTFLKEKQSSKKDLTRSIASTTHAHFQQNDAFSQSEEPLQQTESTASDKENIDLAGLSSCQSSTFTHCYVALYDQNDYFADFNTDISDKKVSSGKYVRKDRSQLDLSTEKIISITIRQIKPVQKVSGGYMNQTEDIQVDERQKITAIECMGVLDSDRTLKAKMDSNGDMLAVAINSIHMIYCQVIFTNFETSICATISLFNFVTPEDTPPTDIKGKTNLQIDDIVWTHNDAFLLLVFNTGAIAVLPRLGSQLLQVYNPTLKNVPRKDAHLYQQYSEPKGFNQLFTTPSIQLKIQQKPAVNRQRHTRTQSLIVPRVTGGAAQNSVQNQYKIQMHQSEDYFTIFNQAQDLAFVFRLELAPELTELFAKQRNMSLYFIRFCFSMDKLASDPEILSKIPLLLQRKLPLDEFERNEEQSKTALEEFDQSNRVETIADVGHFQMEDQDNRMETMQDFEPQLLKGDQQQNQKKHPILQSEEPEIILKNLKHLLFACRWQKDLSINYTQWLVTIVNDCFYFFLRKSEPIFAYHCLTMAEYYLQRVLPNQENNEKMSSFVQNQNNIALNQYQIQEKQKFEKYVERLLKQMNSTKEICLFASDEDPNYKINKDVMRQKFKQGPCNQAIQFFTHDLFEGVPVSKTQDSERSYLTFQKNYVLLAFYSLVQFRNYQAANFNIIFLLFGNYIINKKFTLSLRDQVERVVSVIEKNYQVKSLTDQNALFFGKQGNNAIEESTQLMEMYQSWVFNTIKLSSTFLQLFFTKKVLSNLMHVMYAKLSGREELAKGVMLDKKAVVCLNVLQKMREKSMFKDALQYVKLQTQNAFETIQSGNRFQTQESMFKKDSSNSILEQRMKNQSSGFSLSLMANTLFYQFISKKPKQMTMSGCLYAISQFAIKLDKTSPLNCMNQHTITLDSAFTPCERFMNKKEVFEALEVKSNEEFRRVLSQLFFYCGDCERGSAILNDCLENKLLSIFMLGRIFKSQMRTYEYYRVLLADFSINTVTDFKFLQRTTERLNVVYAGKSCLSFLRQVFYKLYRERLSLKNSQPDGKSVKEILWNVFSNLPFEISIVLKEQVAADAVKNMKMILQDAKEKDRRHKVYLKEHERVLKKPKFKMALEFIEMITFDSNFKDLSITFEEVIGRDKSVRKRFFELFEIAIICFYDQTNFKMLPFQHDTKVTKNSKMSDFSEAMQACMYFQPKQTKRCFLGCMLHNFHQFVKIVCFMHTKAELKSTLKRQQSMALKNLNDKLTSSQLRENQQKNQKQLINNISEKTNLSQRIIYLLYLPKLYDQQQAINTLFTMMSEVLILTSKLNEEAQMHISQEIIIRYISNIFSFVDVHKVNSKNMGYLNSILNQVRTTHGTESYYSKLLEAAIKAPPQQPHQVQKNFSQFENHVRNVAQWVLVSIPRKLQIEQHFKWATFESIKVKRMFYDSVLKAQKVFGLNMNTSLFFRGSNFDTKPINLLELNNELLSSYEFALEKDNMDTYPQNQRADKAETLSMEMKSNVVGLVASESAELNIKQVGTLPALGMSPLILTERQNWGDGTKPRKTSTKPGANQAGTEIHMRNIYTPMMQNKKYYTDQAKKVNPIKLGSIRCAGKRKNSAKRGTQIFNNVKTQKANEKDHSSTDNARQEIVSDMPQERAREQVVQSYRVSYVEQETRSVRLLVLENQNERLQVKDRAFEGTDAISRQLLQTPESQKEQKKRLKIQQLLNFKNQLLQIREQAASLKIKREKDIQESALA